MYISRSPGSIPVLSLLFLPSCIFKFFLNYRLISLFCFLFFLKILFIFRERGRQREREGNISVWLPLACPQMGNLACNPGMCPDWETNQQRFGSQASTQSTEPHQAGLIILLFNFYMYFCLSFNYLTKKLHVIVLYLIHMYFIQNVFHSLVFFWFSCVSTS